MLEAIKNYFAITKKEWNGMLVLSAVVFLIVFAPQIYQLFNVPAPVDFSRIKEAQHILDASVNDSSTENYHYKNYRNDSKFVSKRRLDITYFTFNPNHLPAQDWERLGLSERQIKVIYNYEAKGGKFYKPEDLQKIYSITPTDYNRLVAYIRIPEREVSNTYHNFGPNQPANYHLKTLEIVEINQADSVQLTSIRGIGPAFANRILKYRSRLGGFYQKAQLLEVYGLDSAKYEEIQKQIEINPKLIVQTNLNTCSFDDLKRNPYLSFKQMNAIVQYRKQHGNYASISDLKNVAILNDDILRKLEPYFTFK